MSDDIADVMFYNVFMKWLILRFYNYYVNKNEDYNVLLNIMQVFQTIYSTDFIVDIDFQFNFNKELNWYIRFDFKLIDSLLDWFENKELIFQLIYH